MTAADRATLEDWTRRRKTAQALSLRTGIVLACAEARTTSGGLATALGVSRPTVATWRRPFTERRPDRVFDEPGPGAPHTIADEQAARPVPVLSMRSGRVKRRTQYYVRHDTTDLTAALDVQTGKVIGTCRPQHRAQEFRAFLDLIDRNVPPDLDIHLVLDNAALTARRGCAASRHR